MSYKKHISPNPDIIKEITEEQVTAWMVAKMQRIIDKGFPLTSMRLEVWRRQFRQDEAYFDSCTVIHAAGKAGMGEDFTESFLDLRQCLANDPATQAAEKRRDAARAIKEAEQLEALAKKTREEPPV